MVTGCCQQDTVCSILLVGYCQSSSDTEVFKNSISNTVSDPLVPAQHTTTLVWMMHHLNNICSVVVLWGSWPLKNRVELIKWTVSQVDAYHAARQNRFHCSSNHHALRKAAHWHAPHVARQSWLPLASVRKHANCKGTFRRGAHHILLTPLYPTIL